AFVGPPDEYDLMGATQFRLLTALGLRDHHRLLDFGCGSLRAGVHFIRYLEPGNYIGVDVNQSLLDAGYDVELASAGLQARMPRANLVRLGEFEFHRLARQFDCALALSLFTHLPFNHIRLCLTRLAEAIKPGGVFFATCFQVPEEAPLSEPYAHPAGGITTHSATDPYHYRLIDMVYAVRNLPWEIRIASGFAHPRSQQMLAFHRIQ
ncbi:MAG: class I SAM-dependent methyltransferase, partial [Stellaceae bacterium]